VRAEGQGIERKEDVRKRTLNAPRLTGGGWWNTGDGAIGSLPLGWLVNELNKGRQPACLPACLDSPTADSRSQSLGVRLQVNERFCLTGVVMVICGIPTKRNKATISPTLARDVVHRQAKALHRTPYKN
jgi:hypothetical protein